MKETYAPNLVLCVQVKKKEFHAPGLKTQSVSAILALSKENILLSSASSAALGKSPEPRWPRVPADPSSPASALPSPASMHPSCTARASRSPWGF